MKAADLRQQLTTIRTRVASQRELVGLAQAEETQLITHHHRQYAIGNRATVRFSGAPDDHAIVDFMVMLPERLTMLAEVVNHIEQWKAGLIDELVPSGAWPLVGPGYEKSR